MSIKDLPFNPSLANAALLEVQSCARVLHALYDKETHYRFIDPSEAYNAEGTITTVLKGIRPYGYLLAPPSSAYVRALKTMHRGICIVPSTYEKNCFHVFRKGEDKIYEAAEKIEKIMHEKLAKEGYNPIKSLQRVLFSCREWGRIFFYPPKAIHEFEEKMKKMLQAEIEKLNHGLILSSSSSTSTSSSPSSSSPPSPPSRPSSSPSPSTPPSSSRN